MEETLQEIKTSFHTLPSHIRDAIVRVDWVTKIEELALKYSLNDAQKNGLITEVLLVLTAITPEEELAENIKNELEVSSILAEQITEEIGERIFSWIQKLYTPKENDILKQPVPHTETNTLDIPPINLPGEVIEESTPDTLISTEYAQDTAHSSMTNRPEEQPYIPLKNQDDRPTTQLQDTPRRQSFISNKLNQPTNQTTSNQDIAKKYTIDPYREPIE